MLEQEHAVVKILANNLLTCGCITVHERITNIQGDADAKRDVVSNVTPCIDATHSRTGVNTFLVLACFVGWTV